MPLYDYSCRKCKSSREYLVPNPEADPLKCANCGKIGGLERKAVQKFSVKANSNSVAQTVDEHFKLQGAHRVGAGKLTIYSPNGATTKYIPVYKLPNPSSN